MLDTILSIFQGLILVKVGFLIIAGLYIAFLLVMYNQVKSMQRVISDNGASDVVNKVALVYVFIGVSLFVTALVIL